MTVAFPAEVLHDTAYWARDFATRWRQEMPTRIHDRDIAGDGTPDWHPDFEKWLTRTEPSRRPPSERDLQRLRTTRVMRRLRTVSPRSYEVLYRQLVLKDSIEGTTLWLNERAIRNHIPLPPGQQTHYRRKDTVALVIAGIGFCKAYW
jgi:hypothetical protein